MPALWISVVDHLMDLGCAYGLLLAVYRTFKALKPDAPAEKVANILRFWVLFASLLFVNTILDHCHRELRVVLLTVCFWPTRGREWTLWLFNKLAVPAFSHVGPHLDRYATKVNRVVQSGLTTILMTSMGSFLNLSRSYASDEDLDKLHTLLTTSVQILHTERRKRDIATLARPVDGKAIMSPGPSSGAAAGAPEPSAPEEEYDDGDTFDEDDEWEQIGLDGASELPPSNSIRRRPLTRQSAGAVLRHK